MTRSLPLAVTELVIRFFGDGARPRYDQALPMFERRPYQALFERLTAEWEVEDLSDPNYDLGPRWWVTMPGAASLDVRLSFVGPYFLILDGAGRPTRSEKVEELLIADGFIQLDRELLETPVRVWETEVEGVAYEFIFEFDQGVPWS